MRWLNFSAALITFVCFWLVFFQFFLKELNTVGIIWRIAFMVVELGLCAVNTWLFIRGEIRHRKNKKMGDEVNNLGE